MRMYAKALLMAALALSGRAADAQDRPVLAPTRDVAVTYIFTGQRATNAPAQMRVTYADANQRVRIDMFAPTTPDDRLARLAPRSRGFVYCVSLTGVTGARRAVGNDVEAFVRRVRAHTTVPIALGFGISEPSHVAALRGVVDGVVIGSAAIDMVAGATTGGPAALRDFVRGLVDAGRS